MKKKLFSIFPVALALIIMMTVSLIGCDNNDKSGDKLPHDTFPSYIDDEDDSKPSTPGYTEDPNESDTSEPPTSSNPTDTAEPDSSTESTTPTDTEQPPIDTEQPPADTELPPSDTDPIVPPQAPTIRNDVENIIYVGEKIETLFSSIFGDAVPDLGIVSELLKVHEGRLELDITQLSMMDTDLTEKGAIGFAAQTAYDGTSLRIDGAFSGIDGAPRVSLILDPDGNVYLHFPDVSADTYVNILPESGVGELLSALKALSILVGQPSDTPSEGDEPQSELLVFIGYLLGGVRDYISDRAVEQSIVTIERNGYTIEGVQKLSVSIVPKADDPEFIRGSTIVLSCFIKGDDAYGAELALDGESVVSIELLPKSDSEMLYSLTLNVPSVTATTPSLELVLSGRHLIDGERIKGAIQLELGALMSDMLESVMPGEDIAFVIFYDNETSADGAIAYGLEVGVLIDPDGYALEITLPITLEKIVNGKTTAVDFSVKGDMMGMLTVDISATLELVSKSRIEVDVQLPERDAVIIDAVTQRNEYDEFFDNVASHYPALKSLVDNLENLSASIPQN